MLHCPWQPLPRASPQSTSWTCHLVERVTNCDVDRSWRRLWRLAGWLLTQQVHFKSGESWKPESKFCSVRMGLKRVCNLLTCGFKMPHQWKLWQCAIASNVWSREAAVHRRKTKPQPRPLPHHMPEANSTARWYSDYVNAVKALATRDAYNNTAEQYYKIHRNTTTSNLWKSLLLMCATNIHYM